MKKDRAIVIGGSIAGMMAAAALSRHFAAVTILERDGLEDETRPRKGVPQGNHVHVLLTSGMQALEQYFPGILDEMMAEGVDPIKWSEDMRWFQAGSWKTRTPCGIVFYPQSRVSLEGRIRARVSKLPGVKIQTGASVQGLLFDKTRESVTGVRIQTAAGESNIPADLVLEAGGRGSRALKWLEELGYPAPPVENLAINLVYVSRIYQKTSAPRDWKGLASHPLPDVPRGGILLPIDHERWILTVFGYNGEHPTPESESILPFLKNLPVPDLYETLADAKPLSEPIRFNYPQEIRQRFDRLERFPGGFLLMGDAMCSVDPVFGQGMTLSCKEALALDKLLGANLSASALRRKFFAACQNIIEVPWLITMSEALRFKKTPGNRSLIIRFLQWYTGYIFDLSASDVEVYRAFLDVMHLLAGPEALLRPKVLVKVLARAISVPRQSAVRAGLPASQHEGA